MQTRNFMSTLGINRDFVETLNNRAKLDTGTQCNYKCSFCYYIDKLCDVTPFSIIKDRIDYLLDCGVTEVDLSGGESSIHKDWFGILDYCMKKGLGVSTLSNGYKFSDYEFVKKSQEHGLTEILFSLHGHDEESHDRIVGKTGAFVMIMDAIKNSNELGLRVRINCTVSYDNHQNLGDFVRLVDNMNVFEVNFLTLNYWSAANDLGRVDYNIITDNIKRSIDELSVNVINVRYTPYCFMKGYERYVCNIYQHICGVI